MKGKKRHDFDISFRNATSALYKSEMITEDKVIEVEKMTEGYFAATGEYPSAVMLEKLADVILSEELKDTSMTKLADNEYPILSDKQIDRRKTGRYSRKASSFTVDIIEEEVNYHKNEFFGTYFIYKPTLSSFEKSIRSSQQKKMTYFDNNDLIAKRKYSGRSEGDVKWSKSIKLRDDYCCQNPNCSSRVGIMHAHHIESYVDNPELRTEITNGTTLCSSCHNEFHSVFGKGGNNRKQLETFFIGA